MSALFAYYFPQFYETKENSSWWGPGFTDWDLVKSARPLFGSHYQPRIPLSGYYDQSAEDTLRNQVLLANKYSVTGFNFYHYWFDGSVHLSKPSELLIANKDLNIKFMFTWANESWTRQWVGKPNDYLIKQNYYRNRADIEKHYRYLAEFFKDDRYHKVDNCPVFSIYRPELIPDFNSVKAIFNEMALADGFSGIHWLACRSYDISSASELYSLFNGVIDFNPRYIINTKLKKGSLNKIEPLLRRLPEKAQSIMVSLFRKQNKLSFFSYNDFLSKLDDAESTCCGRPVYHSVFPDWDNTARYNNRATLFTDVSARGYERALEIAQSKLTVAHQNIIFINAWNEWSEGAYLEPDQLNNESLLSVTSRFSGQ